MNGPSILCPKCYTPLPASRCNTGTLNPCPACAAEVQAQVYPAAFRTIAPGQTGERIIVEGESSCFYHEQKKAIVPCDICGRFLCAVCDVELDGRHVCPPCLDAGREKGTLQQLQTHRTLYDSAALMLAVAPIVIAVFWWFTIITAPVAIILGVMSFYKPNSILGFSRFKAIAAIVIALLQIAFWVLLFLGVIGNLFT